MNEDGEGDDCWIEAVDMVNGEAERKTSDLLKDSRQKRSMSLKSRRGRGWGRTASYEPMTDEADERTARFGGDES